MKKFFFGFCCCWCLGFALPVMAEEKAVTVQKMVDAASGIEFSLIPAGCFSMGADRPGESNIGWPIPMPGKDEVPRHEVCVDAFWLGVTELTREQWMKVTGKVLYGSNIPVIDLSWDAAVEFTAQLTAKGGGRFRLPTEAEWEYACHAGTFRPVVQLLGGDDLTLLDETLQVAWYRYQSLRDPTVFPVKAKQPNAWGLYDILGNLWEWTQDGYDAAAYAQHARKNPVQLAKDERRVLRGGSYKSDVAKVRCGARSFAPAYDRSPLFGMRVVREVDAAEK